MHYASDTNAGRHIAAAVWQLLVTNPVKYATLASVLTKAQAEWKPLSG